MEKIPHHSPDLTDQNIEKLLELFPNVSTETGDDSGEPKRAIDFDLLRQELSDRLVEGPQERYQLDWPGKRQALLTANAPIAKTLRPVREESVDFDNTKNIFIEGDNLDALKLLHESYLGKVKLIYIDPPYNTGSDFVYQDDFVASSDDYLERSGQMDHDLNRLRANPESNGRFHSDWLNMMYPRLKLARNLLAENGVIMISIDDNEVSALKLMCDEIFGVANFEASFVWQRKQSPQRDATNISTTHDSILVYSRKHPSDRNDETGWLARLLPMGDEQLGRYKNPDDDPRGVWASTDLTINTTAAQRPNKYFPIENPNTGEKIFPSEKRTWLFDLQTMNKVINEDRIWWGANGNNFPRLKAFLSENQQGVKPQSLILRKVGGDNQAATRELNSLFPEGSIFDTPKPTDLIRHLCYVANVRNDDIVCDFFSGSATTAHAVMSLNAEDGEARRFILVQLPEPYGEESPARAMGLMNLADAGKERIRRVSRTLREGSSHQRALDLGFRALRVDSDNLNEVTEQTDILAQESLMEMAENIKPDRSSEDLLFGCLVAWGLDLCLPVSTEVFGDSEMLTVDDDAVIACFDATVDSEMIREIASRNPMRAVFRDSSFLSDADRINAEQIFKEISPATEVKVI